jgi:acetyl-CoA acetyltransferase
MDCSLSSRYQGKKGGFKDTHPEELLAAVLEEVVSRGKVDVNLIE